MGAYAMTGGATGIGAGIKQRLTGDGQRVIVVDIKEADILADLSSPEARQKAIEAIGEAAPQGLDGFVACAGVGPFVPDRALIPSVNYFGAVALVEGVRPLLAAKRGAAVLISSNSAPMETSQEYVELLLEGREARVRELAPSLEGQALYAGSKQALTRWMRHHSSDYAAQGIRLNAVAPGYTNTPMNEAGEKDSTYGDAIRQFKASIPIGRAGEPADIANAVAFLLGPQAGFICGAMLFVDGGHDAMLRPDSF